MKKILSIFLIICIVFSVMAGCFVNSSASRISVGDFNINTEVNFTEEADNEAQLAGYLGEETVVNIPEYLNGYKITSINYSAFSKSTVEQITIPKTVVNFDLGASSGNFAVFNEAANCSCIIVDDENDVFCSENGLLYSKDKTELIRVPSAYPGEKFVVASGVKKICKSALKDCGFSEIEFPDTLEYVDNYFIAKTKIAELYFPDSLTGIAPNALATLNNYLKSVYFGSGLQLSQGFETYPAGLTAFFVSGDNPYLSAQDGIIFNKDKTKLIAYPSSKTADTYAVPDSVKTIAKYAFKSPDIKTLNTNLTETLENEAIVTPSDIIFGKELKSAFLSYDLIRNCKSITFLNKDCAISVDIPLPSEKKTVYGYYGSTAHILFGLNDKYKEKIEFVLLDEEPEEGFKYTELDDGNLRVDSFFGLDTTLEIPSFVDGKKVVEIGAYAFKDNTSITVLTVPSSIKKISAFALSGMSALTKLNINSFECVIEDNAFAQTKVFSCSGSTAESYAKNHGLDFVSVGHQFESEEIENEKLKKTCSVCGYTEIVDNPSPTHEYEQQVIAPTCTEQGYTVNTCKICGSSYNSDYKAALGHDPFELKATSPTCKVEGKTSGIKCARCQLILKAQEPIAKLAHEYDGGNITTQPTCTEPGVKTFRCRNCDDFYTEPVEKIPHNYIKSVKAPTCTQQGYTTYTCSYCEDTYQSDITAVLPHQPKEIPAVPATCTSEGSTKGYVCENCGFIIEETKKTEKIPHKYDSGKITLSPTCQREGTKRFSCKNCNYYYEQKVAKIDHIYVNTVKEAASFSKNGVVNNECSMCKLLKKSSVVKSIKTVKISANVLTYTGKKLALPKVTVKDSAGKTISASNYTLSYISRANSKAVNSIYAIGQYKIMVKFKNSYSGTRYLYFTVKPRKITNYAPSSAKKSVTAKWKKDTSAGGYQVLIATNKAFTSGKKTININNNAISSKKITSLKSGKIYYIKIRSFKKISVDGKKLNIYSDYSALKSVKCK